MHRIGTLCKLGKVATIQTFQSKQSLLTGIQSTLCHHPLPSRHYPDSPIHYLHSLFHCIVPLYKAEWCNSETFKSSLAFFFLLFPFRSLTSWFRHQKMLKERDQHLKHNCQAWSHGTYIPWAGDHCNSIKLVTKNFICTRVYARSHEQNGQEGLCKFDS